jgi:hypothetical protein
VFARLQSRSSVLTLSGSAKLRHRPNPPTAPRASTPTTSQFICKLVTLRTPVDSCIPFLFNHPSSFRLRRRPTERPISPLFLCLCRCSPSQQGVHPLPLFILDRHPTRSLPFPAVHPISLQPLTICSSRNSFVLTTIHFHGGCIPPSFTQSVLREGPIFVECLSPSPVSRNHSDTGDSNQLGSLVYIPQVSRVMSRPAMASAIRRPARQRDRSSPLATPDRPRLRPPRSAPAQWTERPSAMKLKSSAPDWSP